jgi:hypothetical protein
MFGRLLDRFKPKRLEDPVFGSLLFFSAKDPYWQGQGLFLASGESVELFVYADEAGPGETQQELYRLIGAKYRELFEIIHPLLQRAWERNRDATLPTDTPVVFSVSALSIARPQSQDMEWEISFSCSEDPEWVFSVEMRGWEPTGQVLVDH